MSDGRSKRKAKVVPFLDRLDLDRTENLNALIARAKMLKQEGFEDMQWSSPEWKIKGGRLLKQSGKNTSSVSLRYFHCLLYTSPSPRDQRGSRMPSSA